MGVIREGVDRARVVLHELAGPGGPEHAERRGGLVGCLPPALAEAEGRVAARHLVQQPLGHRARRQPDVRPVGVLDGHAEVAGELGRRRRRAVRAVAHQPLGLGPHPRVDAGQDLALCRQARIDQPDEAELLPSGPPPVQCSR
ncbi:MAG: hypothetical protein ACRD0H_05485 [Actinomycetes bacterium]